MTEWGPRTNLEYHDAESKQRGNCPSILTWRDHTWINFLLFPDAGGNWWRPAYVHNGVVEYLAPRMRSGHSCHRVNLDHKLVVQLRVLTAESRPPKIKPRVYTAADHEVWSDDN
jgi:hypothetical protein